MSRSPNILILLCTVSFCYINAQKVDVSVYYEALCSHSIEFMTKQLYPALQNINITKHVNLRLIPYGKTKTVVEPSGVTFTCNHGQRECYANKIHACALAKLPSPTDDGNQPFEFIKCAMVQDAQNKNRSDTNYPVAECTDKEASILQCARTAEGHLLLNNYGLKTDRVQKPLDYCPTIVFNGEFDADVSKKAETDFINTLCGYIKASDKPEECYAIVGAGFQKKPLEITLLAAIFILLTIFQGA